MAQSSLLYPNCAGPAKVKLGTTQFYFAVDFVFGSLLRDAMKNINRNSSTAYTRSCSFCGYCFFSANEF